MAITKRYTVPRSWPIRVKEKKYVVSPVPGPHSKWACIPLGLVLRDVLGHARTMKEARTILSSNAVKINGTVRKSHAFPVGLMDVIEIGGDFYRVLPAKSGLHLRKTAAGDASMRLAKIENKVHIKNKKLQLNLHDGTNVLVDKDEFKTSDVVVIENWKIKDTIKFEKGSIAIVTAGNNAGKKGVIDSIDRELKTVMLKDGERKMPVPIPYIFVVGRDRPVVDLGE